MRFVLIHGGFHGAWCWTRTIPEIQCLGHEAIAIDLPGHGARRDERSTIADRRDAILEVLESGDVLVGHSGGGLDITFAVDAAPTLPGFVIYLAAALPIEGKATLEATGGAPAHGDACASGVKQLMTDETGMSAFVRPNDDGRMECADYPATREFFYHDVDEETARWAFDQLTPAPTEFLLETVRLPNFWAAAGLGRSFIRCLQDHAMPGPLADSVAHRLGVEQLAIDASHSPFLSRPRELAELLVEAPTTKPVGPLCPT